MNKKGFMMAELIVVSAVILTTLVSLYTSYNKIYSIYKTRIRYYDVATLYRLGYYRDVLKVNNILDDAISYSNSGIVEVYNSDGETDNDSLFSIPESELLKDVQDLVYMVNNNRSAINRNIFAGKDFINVTFLEYVDFLENSVDFTEFDYMLIMERCALDDEDKNNCSYAYLEVWPEILPS